MTAMSESFPVDFQYNIDIVKAQTDSVGDRVIEGFAATGDLDLQGDLITPEGLRSGAETLQKSGILLWNHTDGQQIGEILKAVVQDGGIWIKARLKAASEELKPLVDRVWSWVKEGIISKFSIQGSAKVSTKDYLKGNSLNFLTKMNLFEASLVLLPANTKAQLFKWYVQKSFSSYFSPKEEPFSTQLAAISYSDRSFEGLMDIQSPVLMQDIIDGIQASPTVCLTKDLPGGVVEEIAKYNDKQIYMKIRFASTWSPGVDRPPITVKGVVVNSEDSLLGFVPKGVWIDEENSMANEKDTKKADTAVVVEPVKADPVVPPEQPAAGDKTVSIEDTMKAFMAKVEDTMKALQDKVCALEKAVCNPAEPVKADPPVKPEEVKPEPSNSTETYPQVGKSMEFLVNQIKELQKSVSEITRESAVQKGDPAPSKPIKKDENIPVFAGVTGIFSR